MFYNYHFKEEASMPSPALIYYKELLTENTQRAIAAAGSADRLWPHVKSHKSEDFLKLQTALGIKRFKCATIAEAETTARTDAEQILLAYPLVGPNIGRFIRLQLACPEKEFYALGDNLEQLQELSDASLQHHIETSCLADVNTGMNRTGVPFDRLIPFCKELAALPGLHFSGLHCYDGDRHEEDYSARETMVLKTVEKAEAARKKLAAQGLGCSILVMGGSPTFPCYAGRMEGVYFSPGTVFVYDAGYEKQFPDLPYIPAATVLTRVISHPADGFFTLDAGYKALSAEQRIRGVVTGLSHASEVFQSEEHWTFRMDPGWEDKRPAIGTIFYVIPWHICPTTALYDCIQLVENGSLAGKWPVSARNRVIGF